MLQQYADKSLKNLKFDEVQTDRILLFFFSPKAIMDLDRVLFKSCIIPVCVRVYEFANKKFSHIYKRRERCDGGELATRARNMKCTTIIRYLNSIHASSAILCGGGVFCFTFDGCLCKSIVFQLLQ